MTESEKSVNRSAEALYALRSEIKGIEGQIELYRREAESLDESNRGRNEEITQLQNQLASTQSEAEEAQAELLQLEESLANESETVRVAEEEARVLRGDGGPARAARLYAINLYNSHHI